jgi:hypothetical protein
MSKRIFKIQGEIEIKDVDWSINKINETFKRMLKEVANIEFDGKIEEVYE